MPYHQGLTRAQGDPGFFSFIGKALGGVAKTVGGIIPGPIGTIVSAAGTILAPPKATKKPPPPAVYQGPRRVSTPYQASQAGIGRAVTTRTGTPAPVQTRGGVTIGLPPAARAPRPIPATIDPQTGEVCCRPRRRRIDPLNVKALRRANTRQKSFLRVVDRTLKSMPTRGSVASRRKKIAGATRRK